MTELVSITANVIIIAICFPTGIKSLNFCNVNKRNWLVLVIASFFIAEAAVLSKMEFLGMPLLLLASATYLIYIKNHKINAIISPIIMIIATLTMDAVFTFIMKQILSNERLFYEPEALIYKFAIVLVYGGAVGICAIIGWVLKHLSKGEPTAFLKKKSVALLIGNLATALAILYFNAMYYRYINNSLIMTNVNAILFSVYFLTTVIMTWFYFKSQAKEIEYYNKQKEFDQMMSYVDALETINNDNRKFKHDYMNVVYSIYGYIEEGNIDKLNTYFEEHLLPKSISEFESFNEVTPLTNLKVTELKGLLTTKMLLAKSKKIDFKVEVLESIDELNMDIVDLCRLLGILVDNAIEEVEQMVKGNVQVAFIKNSMSKSIIVKNTCQKEIENINQLFKKGYSSKGENRGLGLTIVKEIVDKNRRITLNTSFSEGCLTHELILGD